ncbi:GNAT family N-acetyltransferase [Paraburkholderia strydomiana]|uniref:GNAT family N-acetyltransferase n=1 Tax=Paraburkholderia strydomiana TaxID=1245417 RepID=UPI0038BAEA22
MDSTTAPASSARHGARSARIFARSFGSRLSATTILVDAQIAGFVIVDDEVHATGAQFNIGYFFVARRYRGLGVGTQAVSDLLRKFPGSWQISHVTENLGAVGKGYPRFVRRQICRPFLEINDCNATLYRFAR